MSVSEAVEPGAVVRAAPFAARHPGVDRLRGLAMVLMVGDHLLVISGQVSSPWRFTVTRAALPLFFVIGGHFARTVGRRTLGLAVVGFALPLVVPWVDSPNVLVWFALGSCCVVLARRAGPGVLLVLVLVPLTLSANGYDVWGARDSYDPLSLVAVMALGALVPRRAFDRGAALPAVLGLLGRYPLRFYVGHLVVLEVVRRAFL